MNYRRHLDLPLLQLGPTSKPDQVAGATAQLSSLSLQGWRLRTLRSLCQRMASLMAKNLPYMQPQLSTLFSLSSNSIQLLYPDCFCFPVHFFFKKAFFFW